MTTQGYGETDCRNRVHTWNHGSEQDEVAVLSGKVRNGDISWGDTQEQQSKVDIIRGFYLADSGSDSDSDTDELYSAPQ
jgi:hypothetical protein